MPFPCTLYLNSLNCNVTSFSAFLFLSFNNMVAAAVVPWVRPPLRSTVFSIIDGCCCFRSLILAYTWCRVIHGYNSYAVSTISLAAPYLSFWPSTVSMMTSCATWSITFLCATLLAWIQIREGSCWICELWVFWRVLSGRVGLGCVGVRHYFWVASDGQKDRSIDWSVGNPTPVKENFVTMLVSEFYLVLVSEFCLVSVPDILYGRLRDFYMILNCVGTQKLNLRLCRMRARQ